MNYELSAERTIGAPATAVLDGFIAMYGPNRPPWIHRSELDLRPGGAWTVDFGQPGPPPFREDRVITTYEPGRRLIYAMTATYQDAPALDATVTIDCETVGDRTLVRLTQGPFSSAEQRDEFRNAWQEVLDDLKSTVEESD